MAKQIHIVGKVVYMDLGPGFWGIVDDRGGEWRPVHVPDQLKLRGKAVRLTAEKVSEDASVFMWGTPVRIVSFHT